MCGIIGYTGSESCYPILKQGLERLEYRGYDSSGVCFAHSDGKTEIYRQVGTGVEKLPVSDSAKDCTYGMAHTRWATHGSVCAENAHPHKKGKTVIVHNGIIENYAELKGELEKLYRFESSTDTEVLCALIDREYSQCREPVSALTKAIKQVRGSYAICVIFEDIPGRIFAVRYDNPLVICKGKHGVYIASDMTAVGDSADGYFIPEENAVCIIDSHNVSMYKNGKQCIEPELAKTEKSFSERDKGEYEHYMLKEIHETGKAIRNTALENIKGGEPYFECLDDEKLKNIRRLTIVACGTAMHSGLCAKWLLEKLCRVRTDVCIASEFRYSSPIIEEGETVIFVSQSGETADTVGAMRYAKSKGAYTVGIVNVRNSTLERECDGIIRTKAGPEIAVASTKAYSAQLTALWLLGFRMAYAQSRITDRRLKELTEQLCNETVECVASAMKLEPSAEKMADAIMNAGSVFFVGRGLDSYLCTEASLKLKEISYIHSEACPAGELKHGTISLVSEAVPIVAIVTEKAVFEKTVGNIKEMMCRGGRIDLICTDNFDTRDIPCESKIILPECDELFTPFPTAIAFQMLAYFTSVKLGRQVDKPRNLAKSVTVE